MAKYLHYALDFGPLDVIQVTLNTKAYIRFLDDKNYVAYRAGKQYEYNGGIAQTSPAVAKPPAPGHWHVCIDLGMGGGDLQASVHILQETPTKKKR